MPPLLSTLRLLRPPHSRAFSLFPSSSARRLSRLKEQASLRPADPHAQAALLRELAPAAAVTAVESGGAGGGLPVTKEYLRALSKTSALRPEKLPFVLAALNASNAFGSGPAPPAASAAAAGAVGAEGAAAAALPAAAAAADAAPLQVALAEPSMQSQLWKLVRVLGSTFLFLGFLGVLMEERGGGGLSKIKTDAEPEPESADPVTFADVAGADEAKDELQELVAYLRDPASFTRLGGKVPSGVLLVGPPGTGKTLLAKALAGEARVPFFFASGSGFEEMYVGVGAKRVRELFATARKNSPCIVFIDEIDALCAKRSPRDSSHVKLAFFELLQALDGFRSTENVIVIAATNNAESLDPAIVRPGRFDRHITVPNPDVVGRSQILDVHAKGVPMAADVELEVIARGTPGFSGADLSNLVNSAAVKAAVDKRDCVSMAHLEWAKDKILMGAERPSSAISESTRQLTARHESGHAICAIYTAGALPVHKATIVPRGRALGMVAQLPDKDETSISKQQMMARLVVCMGGRVAEELYLGPDHVTSGAQNDFEQATRLAEAMVTQFGLSSKLGPMVYERGSESPETRALIESEMRRLLDDAYAEAKALLTMRKAELGSLAEALLDRETLTGVEVRLAADGKLPPLPIAPLKARTAEEDEEVADARAQTPAEAAVPSLSSTSNT